jgi:hypothetical protein
MFRLEQQLIIFLCERTIWKVYKFVLIPSLTEYNSSIVYFYKWILKSKWDII